MEAQDFTQDESCIVERGQGFLEELSKKGGQEQQGEEVAVGDAKIGVKIDRSAEIDEARRFDMTNKYRGGDFASHFEGLGFGKENLENAASEREGEGGGIAHQVVINNLNRSIAIAEDARWSGIAERIKVAKRCPGRISAARFEDKVGKVRYGSCKEEEDVIVIVVYIVILASNRRCISDCYRLITIFVVF